MSFYSLPLGGVCDGINDKTRKYFVRIWTLERFLEFFYAFPTALDTQVNALNRPHGTLSMSVYFGSSSTRVNWLPVQTNSLSTFLDN